jgi:rubrerythrin
MTKSMEELLAIGIKAELEAIEAYTELAKNVNITLLSERFEILAKDEARHKKILEELYDENFPGKPIVLPEKSGVPKVQTTLTPDNTISEILSLAMEAEKMAEDYYHDLATKVDSSEKKDLMNYLANIERGHYYFLKIEYDMLAKK